jgi:CRP-like cAMP-binding protein
VTVATARKLGNTLWDTLKAIRPKSVIAVDSEGKEHKINIPDNIGRNRHQHVMQALDGIDWEHVDLLDGKSGLLKRHIRTVDDREPAGELEDIVRTRELSAMHGLLALMLKAQDTALARQQQGNRELLDAAIKMMDSATRRLEAAESRLTNEIDTNYQLSHELLKQQLTGALTSAAEGDGGETMAGEALKEVLPAMIQQIFRGSARDEKKPTKDAPTKNGHAKATASSARQSPPKPDERDPAAS